MPPQDNQSKRPKFTRGEKCIFVHLIITFCFLMLMTLIYFVHLCLVSHTKNEILVIYRRSHDKRLTSSDILDYESIGVVYLNMTPARVICNTLLISERWSLAPAQCTSMREDPDMSDYLFLWKIKFKIKGKHILAFNDTDGKTWGGYILTRNHTESNVKRCLTHSRFNRGDYQNNIGLFELVEPVHVEKYYVAPENIILNDDILEENSKELAIVDWEIGLTKKGDISEAIINRVRPIPSHKCLTYANPITVLRNYEFCVTFELNGPIADHGALFVMNSHIIGFFSWGDIRARGVPLIILNILHYKDWFESMVSF